MCNTALTHLAEVEVIHAAFFFIGSNIERCLGGGPLVPEGGLFLDVLSEYWTHCQESLRKRT